MRASPDENFQGLVLRYRGRTGLTQRQLAERLGVHARSVQAWESGVTYPNAESLQALIAGLLGAHGFSAGGEAQEARALWEAAQNESPRLRSSFDTAWFAELLGRQAVPSPPATEHRVTVEDHPAERSNLEGVRAQDWGDAPDVLGFLGRSDEIQLLRGWILQERCRVVAVLGMGGIGKTSLAARVARDVAPAFERVYWRSVRNAPPLLDWSGGAVDFLSDHRRLPPDGEPARLELLLQLLRDRRCLLVLDNLEQLLQAGGQAGAYRDGYAGYGGLLRMLGQSDHQSCLLMTSREAPLELAELDGETSARTLELGGLTVSDARGLLGDKQLRGGDAEWTSLVARYGGNGLALKVVGESVRQVFGADIAVFLEQAGPGTFGGIRRLLDGQLARLSALEQRVLTWLGVEREPATFAYLAADLGPRVGRGPLLEAVEALRRRSLVERTPRGAAFTLPSVVLEHVTDTLLVEAFDEIQSGQFGVLRAQPLLKARGKDYARRGQERLLLAPLVEQLVARYGTRRATEERILALLVQLRQQPMDEQNYAPGNLVNVLRVLRGDLRGLDLSGLAIHQAFLQDVETQDASLVGADLSQTVLAEAFNYPTAMTLSADGGYLAAGTSTGEVCLWHVADRTLLETLHGHTSGIRGVALSGDNHLMASGSFDGTVRVWEALTGRLVVTMRGHVGLVYRVALSADGRLAASSGQDGTVRLWDTASGELLRTLQAGSGGNWGTALSGDGRLVVSGSSDGAVQVWDVESGRHLATLRGHTGGAIGVALTYAGHLAASGSYDGTVKLWDTASGRLLADLRGHAAGVRGVALSDNGDLVASGSYDGTIKLWDAASAQLLATLHGHSGGVWGLALSGDGQLLASGSLDGTVKLWETASPRLLANMQGFNIGIRAVAASGDGRLVAAGSYDGTVRLWEPATGTLLATLRGHSSGIRSVAVSTDGRLVASGSFDETIALWDAASGRQVATLPGHTGGVWGVALSGDGRRVASGSYDGTIRVWDAEAARLLETIPGHASGIRGVALSHDGSVLVSGSEDRTVRQWDTSTGRLVANFDGHTGGIWSVALSDDGQLVVSGGDDQTVRVWEAHSGRLLSTLTGHTDGVWGVAVSGDGQVVASASFDGTVRLWEALTGDLRATMRGHIGGVWGVALVANAEQVASGGVDGTVRIWSASDGTPQRTLRGDRRYERLDITRLTGVTQAQRGAMLALGAIERSA